MRLTVHARYLLLGVTILCIAGCAMESGPRSTGLSAAPDVPSYLVRTPTAPPPEPFQPAAGQPAEAEASPTIRLVGLNHALDDLPEKVAYGNLDIEDPHADAIGREPIVQATQASRSSKASETPLLQSPAIAVPDVDLSSIASEAMGSSGMDVETLVQQALQSHPAIRQAQAAVAAAQGMHHQVGLRPNPTVGYFAQEVGNDGRAGQHGVYASQTIVRGDKLHWNRYVAEKDVDRLGCQVQTQRQRVETDVRVHFFRALTAQHKLHRAEQFRKSAQRAVEVTESRWKAEEGAKTDFLQSQIFLDQVDLTIRTLEIESDAAFAELSAVVARPDLGSMQLIGQFRDVEPVDADALYQEFTANSPALRTASQQVERARRNLQRQQRQPIPNLTTQFGVGYDDSTNDPYANLQLGIPLPRHNANQGNITTAQAQYAQAIENVERLQLAMRRDIAATVRKYAVASATVLKFQSEILPKSLESLKLVEQGYLAGQVEFLRVLTARRDYFSLTQRTLDAQGKLSETASEIDGMLLSNALETSVGYNGGTGLRGQALSGQ